MKYVALILLICMGFTIIFVIGCSSPEGSEENMAMEERKSFDDVEPEGYFTARGNPFIPSDYENFRNSSDPTTMVINVDGVETLFLYTSCDMLDATALSGDYPMDTTYCYSTTDMVHWTDWGAMITEHDFSEADDVNKWAYDGANYLWAPDINVDCDDDGKLFFHLYLPLIDPDGVTQRIGVATADYPCGPFTAEDNYVTGLNPGDDGYAYDPGILHTGPDWVLTYCDGHHDTGRLRLAKVDYNFEAFDDGGIVMNQAPGGPSVPNCYMEGPDLFSYNVNQEWYYYLIFAMQPQNSDDKELIAYAMATPEEFEENPHSCWTYRGILMDDRYVVDEDGNTGDDEWTNHASIIEFNEQMYFFYHRGYEDVHGKNRQICIEKFNFNNDGTIDPIEFSEGGPWSNTSAFMMTMDESYNDNSKSQPRIKIENASNFPWANFKARYYFTAENGKTPVVDDYWTPNFSVSLEQLNGNNWAVVLDYDGITLEPGEQIPASGDGDVFAVHYSDWSYFDKTNDFSQPGSSSYSSENNLALFDSDGKYIYGNTPQDVEEPISNNLNSQWSGKKLTVTDNSSYADVVCQNYNPEWTSQDWIIETVSGNTIRLKNLWSGKYLTVTDNSSYADIKCQDLNTSWTSQQWVLEDVSNGSKRLKNVWSGKYLTVTGTNDYADIRCQNLNTGWTSQQWWME
jgi:hypothetical protein